MADDFIVADGGKWAGGAPGAPSHQAQHEPGSWYKFIVPGAPNRLDVPKPSQSPWRGVALLNFFKSGALIGVGSGFLAEADVIVTAKHNLATKPYDAVGIWMAYDAVSNPAPPTVPIKGWAVHRDLDLAIFLLGTAQPGVFALGGELPPDHSGLTLAGYALPYADGRPRYSFAIGPAMPSDALHLNYAINTLGGDSGAPVFIVPGGVPTALGVHVEAQVLAGQGNGAVRLSAQVVNDIRQMTAWVRKRVGGQ